MIDQFVASVLRGGSRVWLVWGMLLALCVLLQHLHPENHMLTNIVAGAMTGIAETLLMFPIENIKTQQQLAARSPPTAAAATSDGAPAAAAAPVVAPASVSFLQAARRTWRLQGFWGFYRGMAPVLFCAVPNQALRWTSFDFFCGLLHCTDPGAGTLLRVALAGIGSGIVVAIVTGVPVETAKTQAIHASMVSVGTSAIVPVGPIAPPYAIVSSLSEQQQQQQQQLLLYSGDQGEDSDIDVLEGATIQPLPLASPVVLRANGGGSSGGSSRKGSNNSMNSSAMPMSSPPQHAAGDTFVINVNTMQFSSPTASPAGSAGAAGATVSGPRRPDSLKRRKHSDDQLLPSDAGASSSSSSSSAPQQPASTVLRGWLPTILKKVGNQGVRFPVHRWALVTLCGDPACDASQNPAVAFAAGAIAGIVSIFATQPVDVVKTRMQGLDADRFVNSWHCAVTLLREEGLQVFLHGMGARALRSGLGAGASFSIFPAVKAFLATA